MIPLQGNFNVATEFLESGVADRDPEVASGNILQFMGFVEDYGTDFRQDAGIRGVLGLLFDGEVGEEQVVINNNDVALGSATVHLGDEALFPGTAFLAQASVGPGV